MKFELFPFQMKAVRRLRKFLVVAQANYKLMEVPQAISFTAPTGAGKTIMLAALVEQVYRGNDNYPAQPDAMVVHTFGETADLMINGLQVQYRNPSSISGDDKIRAWFSSKKIFRRAGIALKPRP